MKHALTQQFSRRLQSCRKSGLGFLNFCTMNQEQTVKRGAFIVVEGGDKVGKTTFSSHLLTALKQEQMLVESYRFPNRTTTIGQVIDRHLKQIEVLEDHAIHLLFSANRWECVDYIVKTLMSGTTLIVDRYSYSGIAYSGAKSGLNIAWCKAPEVGLPKPDLVFHVTVPESVASIRLGYGDEIYESVEFQKKVNKVYDLLREESWVTLTADKPVEEMVVEAVASLKAVIDHVKSKPLAMIS